MEAITASSVCAALSLLLPPISYLSGAVVALATLRNGTAEGGVVIAGSAALAGAFTWFLIGTPYPVLAFAAVTWLPVWLLAAVLRTTASQGTALAAAAAMGAALTIAFHLTLGDPGAWWREVLGEFIDQRFAPADPAAQARLDELIDAWAPAMTAFLGAAVVLGFVLTLLLARWWHAVLDNPGGFGREFRELRIDRRVGVAVAVIALATLMFNRATGGLAADLLAPAVTIYLFQGLAVAHAVVASRDASVGWLVGLYVMLGLLPPHVGVVLACVGFVDGWVDFRRRWIRS
ncbi:MAG: hypothetical protein GWN53_13720 [Gammaproteobacteria bacterium]|nr:hypothetical protein [Gammaproteobacteria bacterium]NIV52910.1 hypothetical protein [Gammaproteobacteria bacterium]NIW85181.1 hypothetical protein [Gammaproteobacteria bacterium]